MKTVFLHELRRGRNALLIWAGIISFLLCVSILLFPEMKQEMEKSADLFASMGAFTEAFGMDKLNFGTFVGYFAVECGNVLGLGGAFFAALIGVSALCKEERSRTAEYLLTHPVSRAAVITGKLLSVMAQIIIFNIAVFALVLAASSAAGESIPWKEFLLLHAAYFMLQIEIAGITFGISAFLSSGALGAGLGFAALMYFFNIIGNLTKSAEFLKYITPFGYADGSQIVNEGNIDALKIAIGALLFALGVAAGYIYYMKKDIA